MRSDRKIIESELKKLQKPDYIKFDEKIDDMIDYCENECNKKNCLFGYKKCQLD